MLQGSLQHIIDWTVGRNLNAKMIFSHNALNLKTFHQNLSAIGEFRWGKRDVLPWAIWLETLMTARQNIPELRCSA
jgi:hypothetical protein